MLTPFLHPTAVVLPAPGDELAAHPPCGSAGRPLVPSFACSGPRIEGLSFALGTPQARVQVRRPKNEALSFLGPKRTLLI